jgi:hypothetical protein
MHDYCSSLAIAGKTIMCEDTVKLLGVDIDFLVSFNSHISEICRKTSCQLDVLKRIGRYLTLNGKLSVCHAFILSDFNYRSLSWHFCSKGNTLKLEV